MDYITLPSNVQDAFSGQTNTQEDYITRLSQPIQFSQGDMVAMQTILYPVDYQQPACSGRDNRWHVLCDLIWPTLDGQPVIYSLIPEAPDSGDDLHMSHMRASLQWYQVNKLGLVHTIHIKVADSEYKPVVFNTGSVCVKLATWKTSRN